MGGGVDIVKVRTHRGKHSAHPTQICTMRGRGLSCALRARRDHPCMGIDKRERDVFSVFIVVAAHTPHAQVPCSAGAKGCSAAPA